MSPLWMTIINAVAAIGLTVEGTGVTNFLPPQYGMIFAAVIAAANTIAHATTPPVAGPLVKNGGTK